jgi:hypothetical protein
VIGQSGDLRLEAAAEETMHLWVDCVRHAQGMLGEVNAKSAQTLGQLQPFRAVFPQECMGQHASFGLA